MAAPDDDFEIRLSSLEREVASLREQAVLTSTDVAAARVLAAGADHDVSEVRAELRAHTQGLNALRETQLEQGGEIVSLRHGLAEQGREMRAGFDEMRAGFPTMATGMAQITTLLTNITGRDRDDI
jgi:hypothetical protein